MGTNSFKWGIMGCGNIAGQFATSLQIIPGAVLHAVASRTAEKASEFGSKYNALKSYDSYENLVRYSEVD